MAAVELKEIHTAYIMAAFLRAGEARYGPALSRVDHTTRPTATTNNAPEVRLAKCARQTSMPVQDW